MEWSDEQLAAKAARDTDGLAGYGERIGYIRAVLRLVPTDEGGIRHGIFSGYRSSWHWGEQTPDGLAVHHDAPLTIENGDRLGLGMQTTVRLYPLFPQFWADVKPGHQMEMREGARVVGNATVIETALQAFGA